MKFSLVVPVYNVEKYIEKCLSSILNQSYVNYEVIIVNDGTKDNSIMSNNDYSKIKKRVKDFIEHNEFHRKNIKNKYILSYSNKSLLFKVRELKGNDFKNEIGEIASHINDFKLKPLSIKDFIYNIYLKKNYTKIMEQKNREFYKEK